MDLEARPRVVNRHEGGPANEGVPPVRARTARAGVHRHPIVVEIEGRIGSAVAPHRLYGEGDTVVSAGSDSRLRVRPVARGVVAAEPETRVVPGHAGLVLHVPAPVELVLSGVEALVQVCGLAG